MKRILLSAATAALVASPAIAADLIFKAPPPPLWTWTGFYVGGNLGYSWGNWRASSSQEIFNFESMTASPRLNGIVGGIQAGYNQWVDRRWLWGIEIDGQLTGERDNQSWTDPELPPTTTGRERRDFVPRHGGAATLSHAWKFPDLGTLRLRAGITPAENWLFYVTGGLAVGQTKYSFTFSQPGATLNSPPSPTAYALSISNTRVGYAVGIGAEGWIDPARHNWTVKLEYLYVDLGSVSFNTTDIDGTPLFVGYRARDNILRVGLNYHLSPPSP
jgi:outer membrane immunogenic protein